MSICIYILQNVIIWRQLPIGIGSFRGSFKVCGLSIITMQDYDAILTLPAMSMFLYTFSSIGKWQ